MGPEVSCSRTSKGSLTRYILVFLFLELAMGPPVNLKPSRWSYASLIYTPWISCFVRGNTDEVISMFSLFRFPILDNYLIFGVFYFLYDCVTMYMVFRYVSFTGLLSANSFVHSSLTGWFDCTHVSHWLIRLYTGLPLANLFLHWFLIGLPVHFFGRLPFSFSGF